MGIRPRRVFTSATTGRDVLILLLVINLQQIEARLHIWPAMQEKRGVQADNGHRGLSWT